MAMQKNARNSGGSAVYEKSSAFPRKNGRAGTRNGAKPVCLHFVSAKKRKNPAKVVWLSVFFVFASLFAAAALFMLFYDFEANEKIVSYFASKNGAFYNNFNTFGANAVFGSFGFVAAVAAWNAVGFIAAKKESVFGGNGVASVIIDVLLYAVYLAGLCGLLAAAFVSQKVTLAVDVQEAAAYGDTAMCGLLWLAMLVFSFVGFGAFIVLRLTGAPLWLSTVAFVLLPALFLVAFAVLCWCVVALIADKIPANFASGSSSGGQTKTYTYTNSMGCETTVVSDNGKDFYDPCSHEYMGSSTDGGQTIIPK